MRHLTLWPPLGQGAVQSEVEDRLLERWTTILLKWETTPRKNIAALARKGVPDKLRSQVSCEATGCASCHALLTSHVCHTLPLARNRFCYSVALSILVLSVDADLAATGWLLGLRTGTRLSAAAQIRESCPRIHRGRLSWKRCMSAIPFTAATYLLLTSPLVISFNCFT